MTNTNTNHYEDCEQCGESYGPDDRTRQSYLKEICVKHPNGDEFVSICKADRSSVGSSRTCEMRYVAANGLKPVEDGSQDDRDGVHYCKPATETETEPETETDAETKTKTRTEPVTAMELELWRRLDEARADVGRGASYQAETERLRAEVETLRAQVADIPALVEARETLRAERDAARASRDANCREALALADEGDKFETERDSARANRDAVAAELERVTVERDEARADAAADAERAADGGVTYLGKDAHGSPIFGSASADREALARAIDDDDADAIERAAQADADQS